MNDKLQHPPGNQSLNWHHIFWFLIVWLILIVLFRGFAPGPATREISYTAFKKKVGSGEVAEITFRGNRISGKFTQKGSEKQQPGSNDSSWFFRIFGGDASQPDYFQTTKPALQDSDLLPLLDNNGVVIRAEARKQSWIGTLIITLLPWLLIFGLFFYTGKKMQERIVGGGRGGLFGFAKSRAKLFDKKSIDVTYRDVAGLDNAKKELREIVDYLKDPSKYQQLGGELPNGILLVGPPGVGKTLLAQATAGEADVPFFSISGSEFIEMFVGVGASRVRDMFNKAKKDAPSIIFIDELDSIGRVRGTGLGGGHDEREQTLNQILAEMDGFARNESVVVLAATNRPDVLDPALIRPGRFDRRITLELPQKKARKEILKTHTRKVPTADDVDLDNLAERTVGLSGADLKNMVNEAALLAARKNQQTVQIEDFDQARDKILLGIEREDVLSGDEKKMVAYHEAGHALLAELLSDADPLQKVSIIPRGQALGVTEQIPEEDRHNLKRSYLFDRIAIMLGGRVAEKIVFEDITTGAGDDLKKASQLARRMICQWGMSDKLGPVTFKHGEPHPFLGRELTETRDFSERTARLIDEEVQRIATRMEQRAEEILSTKRNKLDVLAEQLLEHETLTRQEVKSILEDAGQRAN